MKVLVYGAPGRGRIIVDGVRFITHGNSVEPLVLHEPLPGTSDCIDICLQLGRGQVVVLDGDFLTVYQDGHERLDEGSRVVFRYDGVPAEAVR